MKIKNINSAKLVFSAVVIIILTVSVLSAAPVLNARSAILIDSLTGTVLFEKESNLSIPPASMTKLMSLYLVYKEIESGRVSKDEIIRIR